MESKLRKIDQGVSVKIDGDRLKEDFWRIKPEVKVLIVENCKSLEAIVSVSKLIQESRVFVIIARLIEAYEDEKLRQLCDKIAKPIILQVDSSNSNRLFFTNTKNELKEVKTDDSLDDCLSNHLDFALVCNLLCSTPKNFGTFNADLMKMEVNTEACCEGKSLIELAVAECDLLLLKFLMLFQPEFFETLSSLEIMKSILGISDEVLAADNIHEHLKPEKLDFLNIMSNDGMSLLMLAAQLGKNDVIEFFLKCGLDVHIENSDADTAADFAWNNGHLDSVILLLEADSPFPSEYSWENEEKGSELDRISRERDDLHDKIRNEDTDGIMRFVEHYPKIKCAYDETNTCALVTALKSKKFEIYSILLSKDFIPGIDGDEHYELLHKLDDSQRENMKMLNRSRFPNNEISHIMHLMAKSRRNFRNDKKLYKKIKKFYEALNEIREIQPILKIIALARKLDIVFDFNKESVADMDPTQNSKDILVRGRTIYEIGHILIGAKDDDVKVLAVMAHEFTHYAVHVLYDNFGLPFGKEDSTQKTKFGKIVESCEKNKSKHDVIAKVFDYKSHKHEKELIVRIPELLALHSKEPCSIVKAREDFRELFDFYDKQILDACEREIPVITAKWKIRDLNKRLGVKKEAELLKLLCDESKIDIENIQRKSSNFLIRSSVPALVMCNLLNKFKEKKVSNVDSLHIFIKLNQLLDEKNADAICEAFDNVLESKLFILETKDDTEFSSIKEFFNENDILKSRVVTIAKSMLTKKDDEKNFAEVFPNQCEIDYEWKDLSKASQEKILSNEVLFQGLEMPLSEVLTVDSEVLLELTLEEIFELTKVNLTTFSKSLPRRCINKRLEATPSALIKAPPFIFIGRTFVNLLSKAEKPLTASQVIELLKSERSMILANDSGMGKTISCLQLALKLQRENPHSWVVYIDLKRYTNHYFKDSDVNVFEITADFISSKILNLKKRFEMKFFEHFFKKGKTIFILDGFDEISPDYTKCVLKMVEAIQKKQNMLLVTTRAHLIEKIKEKLRARVLKLQPFTEADQFMFLVRFWSRSSKHPVQHLQDRANKFLKRFQEISTQGDVFAIPLQVRMLAEIYESSDPTEEEIRELNVFSLYQKFMEMKALLWDARGAVAKGENNTIQTKTRYNFLLIHEKFAIENFFTKDTSKALRFPANKALDTENLANMGILQPDDSKTFVFTHQSYCEFFVASFILENVTKLTPLSDFDKLHQMFLDSLDDEKFERVRSFMNGKLELKDELDFEILTEKLKVSLKNELNKKFLQNLVKENLIALTTFMLKKIKIGKDQKLSLVRKKGENGDEALHVAAKFSNLKFFKQLWICIENFCKEDKRTEILFAKGFYAMNPLNQAILSKNIEVLGEILDIAEDLLEPEVFKNLLEQKDDYELNTLLTASSGHPEAFEMVWKVAKWKLKPKDQVKLFFCQDMRQHNVLINATFMKCSKEVEECENILWSIMGTVRRWPNYEDKKNFLFAEDNLEHTALHIAVLYSDIRIFTLLWIYFKKILKPADQKILWLKKCKSNNIFMISIQRHLNQKKDCIPRVVVNTAKEVLELKEIREALTERVDGNFNFITLTKSFGLFYAIFEPEDATWLGEDYNTNQLDSSLMALGLENIFGMNLEGASDHGVSANEFGASMQLVKTIAQSFMNDCISQLVDKKHTTHEFHEIAPVENVEEVLESQKAEIKKIIPEFFLQHPDLLKKLHGFTSLLDEKSFGEFVDELMKSEGLLQSVSDRTIDLLKMTEVLKTVENFDYNYTNLEHAVVESADVGIVKALLEMSLSMSGESFMKTNFRERLPNGHDTLARSLFNGNCEVVLEVWKFYVRVMDDTELKEVFFSNNNQGKVYFIEEENKNQEAVDLLKALVIDRFDEECKKLFR